MNLKQMNALLPKKANTSDLFVILNKEDYENKLNEIPLNSEKLKKNQKTPLMSLNLN